MRMYNAEECRRKSDQHWDMAGLARADGDVKVSEEHTEKARKWGSRASAGGWETVKRIVVCKNDFPHCLLPLGASPEQAQRVCDQFKSNDRANLEHARYHPDALFGPIHYHWKEVPEFES